MSAAPATTSTLEHDALGLPAPARSRRFGLRPSLAFVESLIVACMGGLVLLLAGGWWSDAAPWFDAWNGAPGLFWFAASQVVLVVVLITLALVLYSIRALRSLAQSLTRMTEGELLRIPAGGPLEVAHIADRLSGILSQRAQTQAALGESEARFRALADAAPTLIWMANADGNCSYVNLPWVRFTGRSAEQSVGLGWLSAVHPDDRARTLAAHRAAVRRKSTFRIRFRLRREDGAYRWVLNQGVPRHGSDGELLGYVGSGIDIHDRVVNDQRIRRLTTVYAAMTQANETIARVRDPDELLRGVCGIAVRHGGIATAWCGLLNEDGTALHAVAAAGRDAQLYLGSAFAVETGRNPGAPSLVAVREQRHYVGSDRSGDVLGAALTPAALWRSTAVLPLYREGKIVGVLTVYADEADYFDDELTGLLLLLAGDLSLALDAAASAEKQRSAEIALRELNATLEHRISERTIELELANRELEAFSYSVSHDLRAPLRSIHGFADLLLLEHGDTLTEGVRAYIDRVKGASQRMSRLINDLLDLSRVSRAPLRRSRVDLSALCDELLRELRDAAPERNAVVAIAPGLVANADPGLARIVLGNLLGNAWKFSARRDVASIEIGQALRDGLPMYYVRDNGAGFDMTHADQLFAPFQRLHSEREFPGDGIGLALVQRIVHRHDGFVAAESAPDQGTTIYFSLD